MYNRYIPQSDGSYGRNRVQDAVPQPPPQNPCPPTCEACEPPPPPCAPPPKGPPCRQNTGAGDFLRRLLPKDLDTGDLLVILLLLLMAGESAENQNTALLTLALYLFL